MRHRLKAPAIAMLVGAVLPLAGAVAQDREERYTVRSEKGRDVHIQRREDGSFTLEFAPGASRPAGPPERGLGDRELVITLPEPITSRLLEQWRDKVPVGTTPSGWFVLRFDEPADRELRAMVMSDIARQMGWKPIAHDDVGTLYLRPDVMRR